MNGSSISLDGVTSMTALLQRLPQGTSARELARRLGLWSVTMHEQVLSRRAIFPSEFSRLSEQDLSDTNAYWLSEVFRATEIVGLLEGQRIMLTMESKSKRASTRARIRRAHRDAQVAAAENGKTVPKDPSSTQLADEVEEDQNVQDQDATLAMLAVVLESAKAYKDGCLAATAGISREISFRQAQMGARIR